jgi:hypothetical protein
MRFNFHAGTRKGFSNCDTDLRKTDPEIEPSILTEENIFESEKHTLIS